MIELIQIPWSPFCLVQRRILEFAGVPFRVVNIPSNDRSLVWRLTRGRYYQVPVIRDGRAVLFEVSEESQVLAKYLDLKLDLGLFPRAWEGLQSILWRYIESEVEGCTFRLNDIHWREFVPEAEQLDFLRFKERRFGRGCLEQWRRERREWERRLVERLMPFEQMLERRPWLLDERPRFVDFDLWGMLANYLYTGRNRWPARCRRLRDWYGRMEQVRLATLQP
ncbi:glutathione S-transferase family protein [Limisphaera ngatamarikiensis]|uniref:Glutathione S-transferase family protein n=1 Tax=Limisphaera ngatamarikiensis TaxID=1324935 RepID=A0A6M1RNZ1_9BACT|nr:glutathione S-transferase N-terminal domain-containing protein [Limisphaera ngatamarikiensis]NGO39147.1 glutathione S-transferase family protein [Limisphaera ngatamarikiensis]